MHGYVRRVEDKIREQEQLGQQKKREAYLKLKEKVQKVRDKGRSLDKWNSSDLAVIIQWFHHKGNAAIPKTIVKRLQRYLEVCGRGDPQVPELLDDGTPVIDELIPGTTDTGHENDEAPVLEELEPNDELDRGQ